MFKYFTLIFFIIFQFANAEIIKEIEVKGNKRISTETISVFGDFQIGDNLNNSDLDRILKDLYSTNFFKNVNLTLLNGNLTINLTENPVVQTIIIDGVRNKVLQKKIIENLSLREKSSYVEFLAKNDLSVIKSILKVNGYYFSEVTTTLLSNDNNSVSLKYSIDLGSKVLIKKIKFTGNKIFKDRKLRNIILSEEGKPWKFISNKKYLDQQRINLDTQLLKNFYENNGYYQVRIDNASASLLDTNNFELIFNIDAGDKFFFNDIKLEIPPDYDVNNFSSITDLFKDLKNKSYSYDKIEKILDEIDLIALSEQYEFINATVEESIVDTNKINFVFTINETEKFYVEKINILGNNITQESVIRNSLIVDEGDAFNEILHNKSINSLKGKRIFGSVKSTVIEGSTANKKIININVIEKPTGEISAGAGVGTSGGSISIAVKENNFMGKDIKLNTALQLGKDTLRGIFSITNPNFRYSDKLLKTSFESTKIDKLTSAGYESSKNGFTIGTRYEQYDGFYIAPNISTYVESIETKSTASANYKKQSGDYFDTLFSYGLTYDTRNQSYQATDGYISNFNQSLPLISNNASMINGYTYTSYHEIFPEMVTTFSLYARAVNSLDDKDVRISKRLYLPGRRMRGFEVGKVGPKDGNDFVGGNYASTINIATTLPKFLPELQNTDFKLFFDAGNVWGIDYSDTLDDASKIRSSTGLAIDWYTPIGPLNFSFSQPITKSSGDRTETFRFNLGTTF